MIGHTLTQSGETRFSIVTKPDQVNSEEFLESLKSKLSESIKPFEIKLKPASKWCRFNSLYFR